MRAHSKIAWLFSVLVAQPKLALTDLAFAAADFTALGFGLSVDGSGIRTSIFDVGYYANTEGSKSFILTKTDTSSVTRVYLGSKKDITHVIAEGVVDEAAGSPTKRDTSVSGAGVYLNISRTQNGYSITIDGYGLENLNTSYSRQPLFFQVQFRNTPGVLARQIGGFNEFSYSPTWGLATNQIEAQEMFKSDSDFASSTGAYTGGTWGVLPTSTQTTAAGATALTTSVSPESIPSVSSIGISSSASSSSSSSNSPNSNYTSSNQFGALSTGALVGIIIGGVVALVLLPTGAYLYLRRKTRNQGEHNRDTQDLMADKEARVAGTAPDTPSSGASSQRLNRGMSMPRGGDQPTSLRNVRTAGTRTGSGLGLGESPTDTHPSSSISLHEPYADLPVYEPSHRAPPQHTAADPINDAETEQSPLSPDGNLDGAPRPRTSGSRGATPQLVPSRLGRSDTPGGLSISDYLQEDGMTEDQIRRLEEEERALDEAIEQAGRTGSRAGGAR